jgi:hypothetical protein
MRSASRHLSLVPDGYDVTVYVVLDDLGKQGCVYRETDEARADLDTVVDDLISGQFDNPRRVVAFNTSEGWARDVTEDVAREVAARASKERKSLGSVRRFVERELGQTVGDNDLF